MLTPVVVPIAAADKLLIFSTLPLPDAFETIVVTPVLNPSPVPTVLKPARKVVIPVIVTTFTIFGAAISYNTSFVYLLTKHHRHCN